MRFSIALLIGSAIGTLAQSSSVVSVFLGGAPTHQVCAGEVLSAGKCTTVYNIVCTAGPPYCTETAITKTMTVGPSHVNGWFINTLVDGLEHSASESCRLHGTTSAVCKLTGANEWTDSDAVTSTSRFQTMLTFVGRQAAPIPVTITSGIEKLASVTPDPDDPCSDTDSDDSDSDGDADSDWSSLAPQSGPSIGTGATALPLVSALESDASASTSNSGASSNLRCSRGDDVLALIMLSAVMMSVGALIIL